MSEHKPVFVNLDEGLRQIDNKLIIRMDEFTGLDPKIQEEINSDNYPKQLTIEISNISNNEIGSALCKVLHIKEIRRIK